MGMYKHLRELKNKNPEAISELKKQRLMKWRKEPSTVRIERPTKLETARSLGYKPKQGILVVRQKVKRGGRQRPQMKAGRKPKNSRRKKVTDENYQEIAERKAARKYTNCEVLNSYKVIEDGKNIWYEVILVDRFHPQVLADPKLKKLTARKGRAQRGLTSAGRKSGSDKGRNPKSR